MEDRIRAEASWRERERAATGLLARSEKRRGSSRIRKLQRMLRSRRVSAGIKQRSEKPLITPCRVPILQVFRVCPSATVLRSSPDSDFPVSFHPSASAVTAWELALCLFIFRRNFREHASSSVRLILRQDHLGWGVSAIPCL